MQDQLKFSKINSQGYGTIAKMVMKDRRLTLSAKGIYAYFASFAGAGDTAFPKIETICFDLDINKNTYYDNVVYLVAYGYLSKKQVAVKGKFSHNVYTLEEYPEANVDEGLIRKIEEKKEKGKRKREQIKESAAAADGGEVPEGGSAGDLPCMEKQDTVIEEGNLAPCTEKPDTVNVETNNNSLKSFIKDNITNNNNIIPVDNLNVVVGDRPRCEERVISVSESPESAQKAGNNAGEEIINTVKTIFENRITDVDARNVLKAAKGDLDLIRDKYALAKKSRRKIVNLVGWVISAISTNYQTVSVEPDQNAEGSESACGGGGSGRPTFNNFENRKYDTKVLKEKLLARSRGELTGLGTFNNFEERKYEPQNLEKMLLERSKGDLHG